MKQWLKWGSRNGAKFDRYSWLTRVIIDIWLLLTRVQIVAGYFDTLIECWQLLANYKKCWNYDDCSNKIMMTCLGFQNIWGIWSCSGISFGPLTWGSQWGTADVPLFHVYMTLQCLFTLHIYVHFLVILSLCTPRPLLLSFKIPSRFWRVSCCAVPRSPPHLTYFSVLWRGR